jgi:replication factor A1
LFSIDLLDANNGEIRATLFKEAADKWFPILEQGQVYTITGGRLKVADRKYSKLNNDYELTLDQNTEIKASFDDNIKQVNYNFMKIANLSNVEVNSSVDLLAIVRSAEECKSIISQKLGGKELFKRDLVLYDDSNMEVRFTLWGDKAQEEFNWNEAPILALKGVGVGDYNGRTLSMRGSSSMAINPDLPEAMELFTWRQNGGGESGMGSLSSAGGGGVDRDVPIQDRVPLSAIKENTLGLGEKPDYVTFKGVITHIFREREPWYTACPTKDCNKKVVEVFNGQWSCEKCNAEFPNCTRRYMLYASISDHTSDTGFTLFNDTAEQLLGHTADEVYEMKQSGNEAGYEKVFNDALFTQVLVKARVKQELRDDEMKTKSTVVKLQAPIDYGAECSKLLEAIEKYQ